jgi:hypothetical protein
MLNQHSILPESIQTIWILTFLSPPLLSFCPKFDSRRGDIWWQRGGRRPHGEDPSLLGADIMAPSPPRQRDAAWREPGPLVWIFSSVYSHRSSTSSTVVASSSLLRDLATCDSVPPTWSSARAWKGVPDGLCMAELRREILVRHPHLLCQPCALITVAS